MKMLKRSHETKILAGVCGGIGETYNLDPTLVRIGVVFLTLATGLFPAVFTYIAAWLITPTPAGPPILQRLLSPSSAPPVEAKPMREAEVEG